MLVALVLVALAAAQDLVPRLLPVPPDAHTVVAAVPTDGAPAPSFTQLSATPNAITDVEAWFGRNGLRLPLLTDPPPWVPSTVAGLPRRASVGQGDAVVSRYGADHDASVVVVQSPTGQVRAAFDLSAWLTPARAKPGDEAYVHAGVRWAQVVGDVLYVATSHRTYAASSYGKNAWVTAIDVATGALRWRSDPLVCNAEEFVVVGDALVCGYGFTAEPDALYVLDRATGATRTRIKLKSGPEHLVVSGDRLYVRTYDMDYVFAVGG